MEQIIIIIIILIYQAMCMIGGERWIKFVGVINKKEIF